jgi:hypothetical protein
MNGRERGDAGKGDALGKGDAHLFWQEEKGKGFGKA